MFFLYDIIKKSNNCNGGTKVDDITTDKFIQKVIDILPDDGLQKLNTMIDENEVTEAALSELLRQYNIDVAGIVKAIKEEE